MTNIYKQELLRNQTGLKFTDTLSEILSVTLTDSNAETAMCCAMVMPYLILARTRTEYDASNNKNIARRLDQWIKRDIDSLYIEPKAFQERMSRTKAKWSVVEDKDFDKYLSTGKISSVNRSLTEEAKGGVRSLTAKVDKKTVLDVLREKHSEPCKANLNYLVSNEHPKIYPTIDLFLKNLMRQWLESLQWRRREAMALQVFMPANGEGF